MLICFILDEFIFIHASFVTHVTSLEIVALSTFNIVSLRWLLHCDLDDCIVVKRWLLDIESMKLVGSLFLFKLHTWFFVVTMLKFRIDTCIHCWNVTKPSSIVWTCSWYIFNSRSNMMDWSHHILHNPNKHFICFEP